LTLSFGVSIAALGLVQAALVALPAPRPLPRWLERLRGRWWALVPALSIAIVIAAIELSSDSATAFTYLALVAVPPLSAYALAALTRVRVNPRIWRVHTDSRNGGPSWLMPILVTAALFVLAWASSRSLAGEIAALVLSALACITLSWLLVGGVPARWLRLGIYAMAILDAVLVGTEILQGPSDVLSSAAPAADLPVLQVANFGSARMGFGDLFVAALVGCLLARSRPRQLEAALLVAILALTFDLLFFAVDTLPGTVPVAVALALVTRGSIRDRRPASPHRP
jgi:hypothetical protein